MNLRNVSLILFLLMGGSASAANVDGTWIDTTGNWNVDTNWSSNPSIPGVPGTDFDQATFSTLTTGNYSITLQNGSGTGTSVSLSELIFSSSVNEFTISQKTTATQIIMKGQVSPPVSSVISVTEGTHFINAPVVLNYGTSLNMGQTSASTLTFTANGNITHSSDYGLTVSSTHVSTLQNYATMNPFSLSIENTNFNNDNVTHSGAYNAGAQVEVTDQFQYYATGVNTATFYNYYGVTASTIQFGGSDGTTNIYNDYYYYNSMTFTPYWAQMSTTGSIDIGGGSGTTNFYNSATTNQIFTSNDGSYLTIGDGSGTTNVYNNGDSSLIYTEGNGSYLIIGSGSGPTTVENYGPSSAVYTEGQIALIYIGSGSDTTTFLNFGDSSSLYTSGDRSNIIGGSGTGITNITNSGSDAVVYTTATNSSILLGTGIGVTNIVSSGPSAGIYTNNIFSDIDIGSGSGTTILTNSGNASYIQTNDPTSSIVIGSSGSGTVTGYNSGPNSLISSADDLTIGSVFGTTVFYNQGCYSQLYATRTLYLGVGGNGFTTIYNDNNSVDSCGSGYVDTILSQGNLCVGGTNTVVNNTGNVNMDAYGSVIVNGGLINNTSGASLAYEFATEISMTGGHIYNDSSSYLGSSQVNYYVTAGLLEDNANTNQSGSFNALNYNQYAAGTLKFGVFSPSAYGALQVEELADLEGSLIVQGLSGSAFNADDVLTLINADGGRTGTFSQVVVTGFERNLIGDITYGPNTVDLIFANVLGPQNSFPAGGITNMVFLGTNQNNIQLLRKMTQLRDRMESFGSGTLVALADEVTMLKGPKFSADQTNLKEKQRSLVDKKSAGKGEKRYPARFYAGPTFSAGSVSHKDRQIGFGYSSVGCLGGFDYGFDRFGFGVAVDYMALGADVHNHWGHVDVDQLLGSFYTVYTPAGCEELSINGIVGGGYDWYDFSRVAGPSFATQKAKGKTHGYVFDALIDLEYTVTQNVWSKMPKCCRLIPLFDLQYIHLNKNRFTEHNASVYNLTVQNESLNSLRTTLGSRLDYLWNWKDWSFRPQFDVAWQYEYLNQNRVVSFDALSALSNSGLGFVPIPAGRSTLLVGFDLLFTYNDFVEIEATYDLEYNKLFFDNSFYVDIGVSF